MTGATGNVGAEVVDALLAAGHQVRALVRGDRPAGLPAAAEAVRGDLTDPDNLTDAFAGADGLFLLPGYPGVAAAAKRAGLTRIVLLSGGGAVATNPDNAVSAFMITAEREVRDSGLSWTILRPYAFMSNALRWLDQLNAGDVVREPFATVPAAVTDPFDIAAVVVAALTTTEHAGATYAVSGPESLLPAERLRILGEILGRDLHLEGLSNEEARTTMTAQMPTQYVDAFFSFYVDGVIDESTPQPTVEQVLGRAPRTFLDWAKAHADAFR
ncbi:MAG TPA: NAD(P)H-binding protein [Pseudonocardiaceae bacterium]|nr:NAD(P)H-binding protein [Pseudonocardiaceae bacterium]